MGMPITIEIVDSSVDADRAIDAAFSYFHSVDEMFSTYKAESEIMRINRGEIREGDYSPDVRTVFALAEETKRQTKGYFDIRMENGVCDPSGLVKGWAIFNAAKIIEEHGYKNFYVEASGDIQATGVNVRGELWSVGIRNPFDAREIVKVLFVSNQGVATSGTSMQGQHIYNPFARSTPISEIVSLTCLGPNAYEADRFATAAFAMGREGIYFIEQLEGFEGYMIDAGGIATMTSGFGHYTKNHL